MWYVRLVQIASVFLVAGCNDIRPADRSAPTTAAAEEVNMSGESIDNPQYFDWAGFPTAISVTHRAVTRVDGSEEQTVTTTTYTLLDVGPQQTVVEMQTSTRRFDGLETKNPPRKYVHPIRLTLPPGATRAETKERGEETIQVGGKSYRTKWYKTKDRNEAGEVLTQVWTAADVPGGLVRSVIRTPAIGKTTTTELFEVRIP